ncbi:MAG: protein NO VEIN domain-containing protein [Acutalibacteraceae bacterium]
MSMEKIIFFNCGWMDSYDGLDRIFGGGEFVKENGYGGEIFNFKNFNGKAYGYVRPVQENSNIQIERLGATKKDEKTDGVLVIFTATRPKYGGVYVCGWYKNAVLYRTYQDVRINERKHGDEWIGYRVETNYEDTYELSVDERLRFMTLPSRLPKGSGWKGRSNVWYADKGEGLQFRNEVIRRIEDYKRKHNRSVFKHRNLPTIELKTKVEKAAMDCIIRLYRDELKFEVTDVHKNNDGWDLEAQKGKVKLRIEVKGHSGHEVYADISRKEFEMMKKHKERGYRLAIVTNALADPVPYMFEYSASLGEWVESNSKEPLKIIEHIIAQCYSNC